MVKFDTELETKLASGSWRLAMEHGPFIDDLPVENGDVP